MKVPLENLIQWWKIHGRNFPWRENPTPYKVFISEWMLQRTRADLVVVPFSKFIDRFPTFERLANASEADWLEIRSLVLCLGRVGRVDDLRKAVAQIWNRWREVPVDPALLMQVHGIGLYTARAVAVFGGGRRLGLVDPNIARVLERFWGVKSEKKRPWTDLQLWGFIDKILAEHEEIDPRHFNWALLDLGAMICRNKPACSVCPLFEECPWTQKTIGVGRK